MAGLLDAVSDAAAWDEQVSEGKSLSEREEAVLQALEMMTSDADGMVWVKASDVRKRVAALMGQPEDKLGDNQWIGHILKRLHLLDEAHRKRQADGMLYGIRSADVRDTMQRYDVAKIEARA